jgi:ferredoxin-like protein FixX
LPIGESAADGAALIADPVNVFKKVYAGNLLISTAGILECGARSAALGAEERKAEQGPV